MGPRVAQQPAIDLRGAGVRRRRRVHFAGAGVFDGRDVQAHEAELAKHVHGAHHRLVRGPSIGAHGDGFVAIGAGDFQEGRAQRVGRGVDELAVVDAIAAALRHGHDDRIDLLLGRGREARLRQLDLEPAFLHERGRQHEEDDQQQRDVDQRDQVDLRIFLALAGLHSHALRATPPSLSPVCSLAPSESAKFTAIFSISTTMRSTLPRR